MVRIVPNEWLYNKVKVYESLGAKLEGYGILKDDIYLEADFPKCVYAILRLPTKETMFVSEERFSRFHDGWSGFKLPGHCWYRETKPSRLNLDSFIIGKYKIGFWL